MDLLNQQINDDFENELNINNIQSIKYISNEKAMKFLSDIDNESNDVIQKIKNRINNYQIYEAYSENNDIINEINNKTFIEYINNFYTNIISKALNIKPEYLNEDDEINKNKNLIFNISKNIIPNINKEIQEINEYIFSYTNDYLEKNIYNIHNNIYIILKNLFWILNWRIYSTNSIY